MRLLAPALAAALLLPACGGDSSGGGGRTSPAAPDDAPTAYVTKMKPIVSAVGRVLRGAELRRRGRDFDRGVALLRARRRMARLTADPALLLAHDRLSRALGRGGTLLVAEPGSPYVKAARQAGTPLGPRGAVAIVAPALSGWAFETSEKLRAASAAVPEWLEREKSAADRLVRRAAS